MQFDKTRFKCKNIYKFLVFRSMSDVLHVVKDFISKLAVESWTRIFKDKEILKLASPSGIVKVYFPCDNLIYQIYVQYLRK